MGRSRDEIDEISHRVASCLYFQVNNDGLRCQAWANYVKVTAMNIRNRYLEEKYGSTIYLDDIIDASQLRERIVPNRTQQEYHYIELNSLVGSLSDKWFEFFNKICRYDKSTVLYKLVLMSVLLSLEYHYKNGGKLKIILYKLPESFSNYVEFLIKAISNNLYNLTKKELGLELTDYYNEVELGAPWNVGG